MASATRTPKDRPGTSGNGARPASQRVRRDVPIPYYAQLARILEDQIGSGFWKPGDMLPSEAELCETHHVSRTAVRQALAELAARGLVLKQRGRKTAVAGVTSLVVQELRGLADEMSARGERISSRVLRMTTIGAAPRVAHDLGIAPGSEVVLLSRLRDVDEETIVRVDTYLPSPRFRDLLDIDFTDRSLYAVLRERYGVRPSSGHRWIEAVAVDRAIAQQLGVRTGSPALRLCAVNRDQDGVPFETFDAWYRGDTTRFEVVVDS